MTEEEKKAIEYLKDMNDGFTFQDCRVCIEDNKYNEKTGICESKTCDYLNSITTVLNLIQNRDAEINKLNNVIDRMADIMDYENVGRRKLSCFFRQGRIECPENGCKECIIEYFMKE